MYIENTFVTVRSGRSSLAGARATNPDRRCGATTARGVTARGTDIVPAGGASACSGSLEGWGDMAAARCALRTTAPTGDVRALAHVRSARPWPVVRLCDYFGCLSGYGAGLHVLGVPRSGSARLPPPPIEAAFFCAGKEPAHGQSEFPVRSSGLRKSDLQPSSFPFCRFSARA